MHETFTAQFVGGGQPRASSQLLWIAVRKFRCCGRNWPARRLSRGTDLRHHYWQIEAGRPAQQREQKCSAPVFETPDAAC